MGSVWALVVAAGSGTRFGAPKQFVDLCGRPVVTWSVEAARVHCDGVVVVLPPEQRPDDEAADDAPFGADVAVAGGPTRSASVRCGLAAVPADADIVVIHDAARPLAAPALFEASIRALDDLGIAGAVCAVPVADTLKRVVPSNVDSPWPAIVETVDRSTLVAVQTPQAFRAGVLRSAHAGDGEATDDAALVEALGATVVVVPGDPANLKLTTPVDLAYAEHLVRSGGD